MTSARDLYQRVSRLHSVRTGSTIFGSLETSLGDPWERELVYALWPALAGLLRNKQVTESGNRLIMSVPDAWHAYFICLHLLENTRSSASGSVVFRGHADSGYHLIATAHREGIKASDIRERQLVSALAQHMDRALGLELGPDSWLAVAQHYDVRTPLLDFTTDPAVAVCFADMPSARTSGEASILIMGLQNALDSGGRVLLPPPYADRLYRQRGLFFEMTDPEHGRRIERIVELRFPRTPEGHRRFEVVRKGLTINLLPDDDWFLVAKNRLLRAALDPATPSQSALDDLIATVMDEFGTADFSRNQMLQAQMLTDWIISVCDALSELSSVIKGDDEYVHAGVLQALARDNPALMNLFGRAASTAPQEYLRNFGEMVLEILT